MFIRSWGSNMKGTVGSENSRVGKYKLCKWKLECEPIQER